ncbi:MAG: MTH1187 family thiamine-binding protein [Methanobacteriaceae archaeon]
MITADIAVLPVASEGTDLGKYVAKAVSVIKESGLNYELTGMGTQVEAETLEELYSVILKAQEAVFETGAQRVYTVIKVDDRRDKYDRGLKDKVKTVNDMI